MHQNANRQKFKLFNAMRSSYQKTVCLRIYTIVSDGCLYLMVASYLNPARLRVMWIWLALRTAYFSYRSPIRGRDTHCVKPKQI